MKLFSRQAGEGKNALIILHGLLGSSANWQSLAKRFGQNRTVYTLDLRNHGQSPWSNNMTYQAMAADVFEFINSIKHDKITLLGHSMGGKAAMMVALNYPQLLDKLIIADIAPVNYSHDFSQMIKPMLELDLHALQNRKQANIVLQENVPEADIRAFLLHNLAFETKAAQWYWRPNLNSLLINMPEIIAFPASKSNFNQPALFVHGQLSDYVNAETHPQITSLFSNSLIKPIANAGHWLHAEQANSFVSACESFMLS